MQPTKPRSRSATRSHGSLACLALALTLSTACSDLERLDNIDVPIESEATIPAATPLEVLLGSFPVLDDFARFDIAESETFRNSEYSPDDVDSVYLTTLTMTVLDPPDQDLAFFGEVVFVLSSDGLDPLEIARQDTFPAGETSVGFDVVDDDLQRYVLAREATVTTEVKDSKRPQQETRVRVRAVFDVDIKVL